MSTTLGHPSPAQERLWFVSNLYPEAPVYNESVAFRIRGALSPYRLERAYEGLIARHPILSTSIREEGGRLTACASKKPRLEHVESLQESWETWARRFAFTPFDLASEPPIRAALMMLAEDDHLLVLSFHHIAVDGWSIDLLLREWSALYQQRELPRPAATYEQFVIEHANESEKRWHSQLEYWKEKLHGVPQTLQLPTDHPRPNRPDFQASFLKRELSEKTVQSLEELARSSRVTPFSVFLSVYFWLLSRNSGQSTLCVGSPFANRAQREYRKTVGLFANLLVLRADLGPETTFRQLAKRTSTNCMECLTRQDLPFERLVEALEPQREMGRHPLVQTVFALQQAGDGLELPGLKVEKWGEFPVARMDLEMHAVHGADGFHYHLVWSNDLFEAATMERLADEFDDLLEFAVRQPDRRLSEFSARPKETNGVPPNPDTTPRTTTSTPPATEIQRSVASLWSEALGQAEIHLEDNFFELGGHSLQVVSLLSRVRDELGVNLAFSTLFENPVFEEFCQRVEEVQGTSIAVTKSQVGRLSQAQKGLWFQEQFEPDSSVYNLPLAFRIAGELKIDLLQRCLQELSRRHPATRTRVVNRDGVPEAIVEDCRFVLDRHEPVPPSGVTQWLKSLVENPFDLEQEHPFRAHLTRTGHSEHLLLFNQPHIFSDATSQRILCQELSSLYQETPLATVDYDYCDFAAWQDEQPGDLGYWAETLEGVEPLLPLPYSNDPEDDSPGRVRFHLTEQLTGQIRDLSHRGGTTLFAALWSAFAALMARSANRDELVVATPVGFRPAAEFQRVVGLFVDLLPLKCDVSANPDFRTLLSFAKSQVFQAFGHRNFRFDQLLSELKLARSPIHQPFMQLVFNFLDEAGPHLQLAGLETRSVEPPSDRAKHELELHMAEIDGTLSGVFLFSTAKFSLATIEALASSYERLLQAVIAEPEKPLSDIVLPCLPKGTLLAQETEISLSPTSARTNSEVVDIFCEILEREEVGLNDDFFQLGGHSLSATRVVSRIAERLQRDVSLKQFFSHSTVERLGRLIEALPTKQRSWVQKENSTLSYGQHRLWILHRLDPESPAFHVPVALRLKGRLDPERLERSLHRIVERHEVLRTRVTDSTAHLDLNPSNFIRRERCAEEQLEQRTEDFSKTPFDLSREQPIRALLLEIQKDDHLLLVVCHHIACDGWSVGVLLRELVELYEGREVPSLSTQYSHFAAWQRGCETAAAEFYWEHRLEGAPTNLALPTDRARTVDLSHHGGFVEGTLSGPALPALKALATETKASLFMTLLTGFQVLLSRLSGQEDFLIGAPVSNRSRTEWENLIGFFVNTLVYRADLTGEPTFRTLLERTQDSILEDFQHQGYPFEELVNLINPERVPEKHPLVQVAFAFQQVPPDPAFQDLEARHVMSTEPRPKMDLEVHLWEEGDGIVFQFVYAKSLFDQSTIEQWAEYYRCILETLALHPDQDVRSARLSSEPPSLVRGPVCPRSWSTFVDRFEEMVDNRPEAECVIYNDQSYTYAEVDELANGLAHHLIELGVCPEDRIGLCLATSVYRVVGALGIWKAGGVYLPLDPNYPAHHREYIVENSGLVMILGDKQRPECPVPWLDPVTIGGRTDRPVNRVCGSSLAYQIYTSGSTGRPKGAMLTHAGLANLGSFERLQVTPESRILHAASISFDASIYELAMALVFGSTLVLADPQDLLPGEPLSRIMREKRVTHTSQAPTSLAVMSPENFPDLKTLLVGGEAPWIELLSDWDRPGRHVLNAYGLTESTVVSALWRYTDGASVPCLGPPLENLSMTVLESEMEPAAPGVSGEICLGGVGVGRGYHNNPVATAASYRPSPYPNVPGERLVYTGDQARYRGDGILEFQSRMDDQMKLRGHRIEPGEVERTLSRHPEVEQVVVVLRGDTPAQRQLRAYVLGGGEERELRCFLRDRLPSYMVPGQIIHVSEFPLTPSGKVDRKALPEPVKRRTKQKPQSSREEMLDELWAKVLQRTSNWGRNDNFFDQGGDSLSLVRLQQLLEEKGFEVRAVELFRFPTVASQAELLSGKTEERPVLETRPSTRSGELALVGVGLRFPGAAAPETFWENLAQGLSLITFFSDDELLGVPLEIKNHPQFVAAGGTLSQVKDFDAGFFGFSPAEAAYTDPGQRLYLECAWEALERAGFPSQDKTLRTGVFVGTGLSSYLLNNVHPYVMKRQDAAAFQAVFSNTGAHLAGRLAYALDLTGPTMSVQTACSSALVAVHLARRALMDGECDWAVAGGASVQLPQESGYVYGEGLIMSADGACRAYDAGATGTVGGNGVGAVVLRRLEDAIRDKDPIIAVLKSTATNNDGGFRVGFHAPSVEGQRRVIEQAQREAGVTPEEIGFVEGHGTGTQLGDPIELEALNLAWGESTQTTLLGSVKTNLGHLDAAAGIAGLIKTALAIQRGQVPPSLNFQSKSDEVDYGPFEVCQSLTDWPEQKPLAAVSSFGMGGANAHAILGPPPSTVESPRLSGPLPLLLSAHTPDALIALSRRLRCWLEENPEADLGRVAWTLHRRKRWKFWCLNWVSTVDEAIRALGGVVKASTESLCEPDWGELSPNGQPGTVCLPTYPFQRQTHWIDPPVTAEPTEEPRVETRPEDTLDVVTDVWYEVLRVDPEPEDSLFDLGGNSLAALQILNELRAHFKVQLSPASFYKDPTVQGLVNTISQLNEQSSDLVLPPLVRAEDRDKPPLSHGQERMWFMSQLMPDNPMYNMPGAFRVRGDLDVTALERTFQEIVKRHEPFRTRFLSEDGRPYQVIDEWKPRPLPVHDFSHLAPAEALRCAKEFAAEDGVARFVLEASHPVRFHLLKLAEGDHILTFNLHHVVFDGVSQAGMFYELTTLYNCFRRGDPSPLTPLNIQAADFAIWERSWLSGPILDRQLEFWREELADAPPLLELPYDHVRPDRPSHEAGQGDFEIGDDLVQGLRELGQQTGSTIFMTGLAATSLLLSRFSGMEDLVIGSPVAGRNHREMKPLLGFFVNTLPMRCDLSGDPTFTEYLGVVKKTVLRAMEHQDLPFDRLVEELSPERGLERQALIQVVFAVHASGEPDQKMDGISLEPMEAELDFLLSGEMTGVVSNLDREGQDRVVTTVRSDLEIHLWDHPSGLSGRLIYAADLFEPETLERIGSQLLGLLAQVVECPERRLSEFKVAEPLSARPAVGQGRCWHKLFEEQAAARPDAMAVSHGDTRWSYGELEKRANRLARRLASEGVGPEVRVGVFLERSPDWLTTVLAIHKAGGAYVPLDPDYPHDWLFKIVSDADIALIIGSELAWKGQELVIQVDQNGQLDTPPPDRARPSSLAYVLYTSGTTGEPRGVQISHAGLENLSRQVQRHLDVGPDSRMLGFFSLNFDASVLEMGACWASGACLVLGDADPYTWREQGVTHLLMTPSVLGSCEPLELPALKTLAVGAERCPAWVIARWRGNWDLLNLYGPTEATVLTTVHKVTDSDTGSPPIGRALDGCGVQVVGKRGEIQPIGVQGELMIGGPGVARGYLCRPRETAASFVPDPHSRFPGGRAYRSGDRVRLDRNQNLQLEGRADQQLKVRGYRIEPDAIESLLLEVDGVEQVMVTIKNKILVAYLIGKADEAELREHLSRSLPRYMLPQAFLFLESYPRLMNKKIDLESLPVPTASGPTSYVEPQGEMEEALAEIMCELLPVERVGAEDGFFQLGGDSIVAVQVVSRAGRRGIALDLMNLMELQTVRRLAEVASRREVTADKPAASGSCPLTPIQLMFLRWDGSATRRYALDAWLEVNPGIDVARLTRVISELARHHDALRLGLSRQNGRWVQEFRSEETAPLLKVVNLAESVDPQPTLNEEIDAALNRIDPRQGPLLQAVYFGYGPREPGRFWLGVHHLATDGVSMRILVEDIADGCQRETEPLFGPRTSSFQTWAEDLVALSKKEELLTQLEFWRGQHGPELPLDFPDSIERDAWGTVDSIALTLTPQETTLLRRSRHRSDPLMIAALLESMCAWTGHESLQLERDLHGREQLSEDADFSRTVGWFTSAHPVLLQLEQDPVSSVARQLETVPRQGIGYGVLRYLNEELQEFPPSRVCFNNLGLFQTSANRGPWLGSAQEDIPRSQDLGQERSLWFEVSAAITEDSLTIHWVYWSQLHRRETVERLAEDTMERLRGYLTDH
jgi:amino acid adenylation domain-containing protein/non-ribosomal peptide synthase protein (TIGR01720 family)